MPSDIPARSAAVAVLATLGLSLASIEAGSKPSEGATALTHEFGDLDGDGDLDAGDWLLVTFCQSGPTEGSADPSCNVSDGDHDIDVDLRDDAAFQRQFTGRIPRCGDGVVDPDEGCDDGNPVSGDGCSPTCAVENPTTNDSCTSPTIVTDTLSAGLVFNSIGASTDGPPVPASCSTVVDPQIAADVWFRYTATCIGPLVISLCGSEFDTELAVYAGAACPTGDPHRCNDDGCGATVLQSRVVFDVVQGQQFLIRVGGFQNDAGQGLLTILCNVAVCGLPGSGGCSTAQTGRGCENLECCQATCDTDPYCCDVAWDESCAIESPELCAGHFDSCGGGPPRDCLEANNRAGCSDTACCDLVCSTDPYCCLEAWDQLCADAAALRCP